MTVSQLPSFSPKAAIFWKDIPAEFRKQLLDNVYCSRYRTVVRIVDFSGAIKGGDLLLSGRCAVCAGTIARLIEAPGT
jgi:hypothetical protein